MDMLTDQCEKIIGPWHPENNFMCIYSKLDESNDTVENLDPRSMDLIGTRAKELNKELDDILRRL
jgi:hypothetical protein